MDETGNLDRLERQTAQLRRQMALDVDEVIRRVNPRRLVRAPSTWLLAGLRIGSRAGNQTG
jgi:hypothetical protein